MARSGVFLGVLLLVALFALSFADHEDYQTLDGWLQYISDTSDDVATDEVGANHEALSSLSSEDETTGNTAGGFESWMSQASKITQKRHDKSSKKVRTIVVAKDGSGHFRTIQAALYSIPAYNSMRKTIYIKAGVYREKLVIPSSQKYITLEGDGADKTIITYNATAGDEYGDEILRTYRCATVGVNSDHFIARNIRFENTAPSPPPGAVLKQAVAFRISGDKAAFYNVAFVGTQDTLYSHSGRHYFKACYIQGTIDFIFGNGRAFFKDSYLHTVASSFGSVTAQKRNESDMNTGFAFMDCKVDGTGIIWLGRAWGNFSRVVYSYTFMGKMVSPDGWQNWGISARDRTVYYAQYKCYGPGAETNERVWYAKELSPRQAKPFLTYAFVNGASWVEDENS